MGLEMHSCRFSNLCIIINPFLYFHLDGHRAKDTDTRVRKVMITLCIFRGEYCWPFDYCETYFCECRIIITRNYYWIMEYINIYYVCRNLGFPEHYTNIGNLSPTKRKKLLRKSWSVPIVKHLLRPLTQFFAMKTAESGSDE